MKPTMLVGVLLLSLPGCTSAPGDELTQQQKDQVKIEVKEVCDSITARLARVDEGWLDYYSDSPDLQTVNADGSRWDYQTLKEFVPEWARSVTSFRWTTTRQDFIFITRDVVLCAWDGNDETVLKSGDKITFKPHAYTMVFRKIAGRWKMVYSHDSGVPVTEKNGD